MRLLFSTLLLAASFERAAATVSVVDNYRDPVVEGEEAAGVGGGFGKEERDLRGGKGGKGDKSDKGGKAKNNKAHKANKYIGPGDCLATYQAIVSNRNYAYSGAGVCLDDIAVELTCESASKCSYAEHSLRPGSAYVMEACATFDPSKELVYDARTGTCTLGADGIGLKRRQENSCRVPTAELSFKMTFGAMDSSGVHIDFSRNGGVTFYTEEEGNLTREAVPASLFQRNLQVSKCEDCKARQAPLYTVGYTQGLIATYEGQNGGPWNSQPDGSVRVGPAGQEVYFDLYYPFLGEGAEASAKILRAGTVHIPPQIFGNGLGLGLGDFPGFESDRYGYKLRGAVKGPGTLAEIKKELPRAGTGCHPLFIYSHGDGGFPAENNSLFVELAKYGFIAAAPYHGAIPLALVNRPNEVVSVYKELKARLGLGIGAQHSICPKIAIGGHSFGAFTSLAVAYGHNVPPELRNTFTTLPEVPEFKTPEDMKIKAVTVFAPSTLNVAGSALFNSANGGTTIPDLVSPNIPTLVVAAAKDTTSPWQSNALPVWNTVTKPCPASPGRTNALIVGGAEHNGFVDRCSMLKQFEDKITPLIHPDYILEHCVERASDSGYGDQRSPTRYLCNEYFSNLNIAVNAGCLVANDDDCDRLENLFNKVNGHLFLLGGVPLCYRRDGSLERSSQREKDLCSIIFAMFPNKDLYSFMKTELVFYHMLDRNYCKGLPDMSNADSLTTQVRVTRNYLMSMFDDEHQGDKECYGNELKKEDNLLECEV